MCLPASVSASEPTCRFRLFDKIQQLSFFDIDKFSSASAGDTVDKRYFRIQQIVLMSMRLLLRSPLMLAMAVFFSLSGLTGSWLLY